MNRPRKPSRAMFWEGHWGVCFLNGLHGEIFRPPVVPGLHIEAIDYAPMVRKRQVLERGGEWRDLTDAEAAAVDAVLERAVKSFDVAICGPC